MTSSYEGGVTVVEKITKLMIMGKLLPNSIEGGDKLISLTTHGAGYVNWCLCVYVCDNGLFVVRLAMNWAVFVFLACAKLKVSCVSIYSHLQLKCSVYRYIVDICKTAAIYLSFIPRKWDIDTLRWKFSTEPGSGHCVNLPHAHSHTKYDGPHKYSYFF